LPSTALTFTSKSALHSTWFQLYHSTEA
jgi:hypothetical protein